MTGLPLTAGTPLSPTLDMLFSRWTPHILWLLDCSGPLRFADLLRRLRPLGTAMLTRRLRELEAAGLISHELYMLHPPRVEYSLTEFGRSVRPVLQAIEVWTETQLRPAQVSSHMAVA
ncbi:winged helix-turn-helix transcriptional regulator [Micromonospora sp. NPDC048898]|uniref:winged helix-turn-helix transcriptional regulator n=1 Tax=Micromonospora sp. NPDC048898 TaxID=3364260 RepID=UPI003722BF1F